MNTCTSTIRVFTHENMPNMDALEVQANDLAVSHGLGIEFVAVDVDASEAMKAGVIGLPAIIAYRGGSEIARRECAFAGRSTRRWFERKVATLSPVSTTLTPAIA